MSDVVEKYASNLETFKLSGLINNEKHFILKMDYSFSVNWKSLKQYWCSVCQSYSISKQKKFIRDSNVIDWDDLANQIIRKHLEMDAKTVSYNFHARINKQVADELCSPFEQTETTIIDKSLTIKAKIHDYRGDAAYTSEIHCQDLLFYGVIDLVKNGPCATATILKDELDELVAYMKDYLEIDYVKSKVVKKYAKQLLKTIRDLKQLAKDEKGRIRRVEAASIGDIERQYMKSVVKMVKLFAKVTSNGERHDWLKEDMTEAEFTTRFITPFIDLVLKSCATDMIFKPGEQKLHLVKDYENSALKEDDTRLPGPNIDGIIKNVQLDIPFSLVEVSGSPNSPSENYNHYKGDRNKLAKNLKYLFKVIMSLKGVPSFNSACKLKLFGIHIYCDQVYVYSLSMPMWDVFVFKLEFKFNIPVKPALFPSTLPTFVSKVFQLGELLDHFSKELQSFLSTNDYDSSSSSDSDKSTFSNPKISPKKRKHHQQGRRS